MKSHSSVRKQRSFPRNPALRAPCSLLPISLSNTVTGTLLSHPYSVSSARPARQWWGWSREDTLLTSARLPPAFSPLGQRGLLSSEPGVSNLGKLAEEVSGD